MNKCGRCGEEKQCMAGESAHPSNWYCSRCDYPQEEIDRLRAELQREKERRREIDDEAYGYAEQLRETEEDLQTTQQQHGAIESEHEELRGFFEPEEGHYPRLPARELIKEFLRHHAIVRRSECGGDELARLRERVAELEALELALSEFEKETKGLPIGHEHEGRGCSSFNWRSFCSREIRGKAARLREGGDL